MDKYIFDILMKYTVNPRLVTHGVVWVSLIEPQSHKKLRIYKIIGFKLKKLIKYIQKYEYS